MIKKFLVRIGKLYLFYMAIAISSSVAFYAIYTAIALIRTQ